MEKVLLLSPSQADRLTAAGARGWDRLLVGSEFCQSQLPSPKTLRRLRALCPGGAGLATSIMTDAGLAAWRELLAGARTLVSEVIVNDWGFLPAAAKAGVPVSAGRLLTRELVKLERGWAAAFLREHGIVSAEADTAELAGLVSRRLGLKVSFHRRSVFKAVTSYCPFERHYRFSCGHACGSGALKLSNKELGFGLLLSEKAYFSGAGRAPAPAGIWRRALTLLPGRGRVSYI
jgi:hypothetical protein